MFSLTRRTAAIVLAGCLAGAAWSAEAPKVRLSTTSGDIVIEPRVTIHEDVNSCAMLSCDVAGETIEMLLAIG